jgi:beta-glucosidase
MHNVPTSGLRLGLVLAITSLSSASSAGVSAPSPAEQAASQSGDGGVDGRVAALLARMTLAEKIGQMTQVEKNAISANPDDIRRLGIGSLLSGGGQAPASNTKEAWADMTDGFQRLALESRLGIPLIYGIDAIHGHNNLKDAVIFPHDIGLGAARDPELVRAVARATAEEVAATGIRWDFAPVVAVPQDIRWGRTYEAFGEDTELVSQLTRAYVEGLQGSGLGARAGDDGRAVVLATPKHYVGDGGTRIGTGREQLLDRGDTQLDEATLRSVHLPPYRAAIAAGAESIMVSYSSWNGLKMHAHEYLLTEVLKGELGFQGFLISDWMALDELGGSERDNIKTAILAGLDMVMVPTAYASFIRHLTSLVESGEIPMARIDDAVRRILRVKMRLGLFERPFADRGLLATVASEGHRRIAREAVARSQVLLKNTAALLPLSKRLKALFVAGEGADDIGLQCGGWTIDWQGRKGPITAGVSLLDGLRAAVAPSTQVVYSATGEHRGPKAEVGIAVVAETPYAEWHGDVRVPTLRPEDRAVIAKVRAASERLVIVVLSGRPLIMTDEIAGADAVVAAFLPGTEGAGVADVLFGDRPFTGRLPIAWPRDATGLVKSERNETNVLFPFGFGLKTASVH